MSNFRIVRSSIAVFATISLFATVSYGSSNERKDILKAVAKHCTPDFCKPKIEKIIDGYATVLFMCKRKNCENDIAYLKKTSNGWILVDQGTGIEPDDLIGYGFPKHVVDRLM